jgi:hypothetical protein
MERSIGSTSPEYSTSEPFKNGVPHGIARQYDAKGRVIGSYRMINGTGLDVWRGDGGVVGEIWEYVDGHFDGYNWWLNDDQESVWIERHFKKGYKHGITREWDIEHPQRLAKGFPQFWLEGKKVSKKVYLAAANEDPSLPRYRKEDDKPERRFPPHVRRAIRRYVKRAR